MANTLHFYSVSFLDVYGSYQWWRGWGLTRPGEAVGWLLNNLTGFTVMLTHIVLWVPQYHSTTVPQYHSTTESQYHSATLYFTVPPVHQHNPTLNINTLPLFYFRIIIYQVVPLWWEVSRLQFWFSPNDLMNWLFRLNEK